MLFRFNGSYEDSDSFRDFDFTERYLIAPALRIQLDTNTTLTWEGEHIENNRIGDRGVPAINGNALFLPPERYIGEPANDFLYTEDYRTSLVLRHRFCNDWTLSLGAYTVFYEFPGSQTQAAVAASFASLRSDRHRPRAAQTSPTKSMPRRSLAT